MAPRQRRKFWRVCGLCFRWCRITVWLLILLLLSCLIYVNQVGLPGFLKKPLLENLYARGLDLQFSRLRFRWYQGIVAENARFGRASDPLSPLLSVAEVQVRLNQKALSRLQLQVDAVVLRQGRFSWPLEQSDLPHRELSADNIQTELRFLPDDQWALDNFKATFAGAHIQLSGMVTNASAVRDWKFLQGQQPEAVPHAQLQARLQRLADTLSRIRFATQPDLRLDIRGDARDLRSFSVLLLVAAPAADTPWGAVSQGSLTARISPASRNGLSHAELRLDAANAQSGWANVTNLSLRMHVTSSEDQTNLIDGRLTVSARIVDTPWCTASNASFSAQWLHSITNPIPLSGEGKFTCDQPTTKWGSAAHLHLAARLATPATTGALQQTNPSWDWWTNLQPYALDWDCHLRDVRAQKLLSTDVSCAGTWLAPRLTLTNITAALYDGQLAARGELNVASRDLHLVLSSDFDPHKIAPVLGGSAQGWLEQFFWEKTPQLKGELFAIMPAWTNQHPDWRIEVQPTLRLDGEFTLDGKGSFRQVEVTAAHTHFIYSNLTWCLPDLSLSRPEGRVEAVFRANERTKDFYWRISSSLDPRTLLPLLGPKERRAFDLFTVTQPPVLDAEVWGNSSAPERIGFKGQVALRNFTFRGESISGVQTALQYTNRVLRFFNPRIQCESRNVSADGLLADFNSELVYLTNGFSTVDPGIIARAIGPHIWQAIQPYEFLQPPTARVYGTIPMHGEEKADLHFDLDGGPFHWWRFNLPHLSGRVHWAGLHLTLSDVRADFYGGRGAGSAAFDFRPHSGTDLEFNFATTNCLLHALMTDLSTRTNKLEGLLSGRLVITKANTSDWNSANGFGEINLRDGLIWDIPIFGVFSPILNGISPGLGNSRASAGACTFVMTSGVLRSNDLDIRSSATRLLYRGTVDLEGRLNARVEAELLRDVWLVGPLVSTVFWPMTKMFEYKVGGTLSEPKTEPVFFLPKIMTLPFHPFRGSKENTTEQSPPASSFSPVPP
jgi:hypothetical protein